MRRLVHFIEKRLHPRYPVGRVVEFELMERISATNVTGLQKAMLVDVSRNGCSLLVDRLTVGGFYLLRCLEGGDAFEVTVRLDAVAEGTDFHALSGCIRWIDNVSDNGERRFRIGVELIPPINAEDLTRLRMLAEKKAAR